MSLGQILGSALSGLSSMQVGLRNVAGNVANANTSGYARVRTDYDALVAGGRLFGVRAGEAVRAADRFLEAGDAAARGEASRTAVRRDWLQRAVALLGSPGTEGGFESALNSVQEAAIGLSGSAQSGQGKEVFVSRVRESLAVLGDIATDVSDMRVQADDELGRVVPQVNRLLGRIAELNDQVVRATASGRSVSGPADRRTAAINELGELVGVVTSEDPSGRIVVETRGGQVLVDGQARVLEPAGERFGTGTKAYPEISVRFVNASGDPTSVTERLDAIGAGGKMGALLRLRDVDLPRASDKVGAAIEALAASVNAAAAGTVEWPPAATVTGAQTGLLGNDTLGLSGEIVVSTIGADGRVTARAVVEGASVGNLDDLVAAINAGLGTAGRATFADGRLVLRAATGGIAMTGGLTADGRSMAEAFGLNAVIDVPAPWGTPVPLSPISDHGAAAGQTFAVVVRDSAGRIAGRVEVEPAATGTNIADMIAAMDAGELSALGTFGIDADGVLGFTAASGVGAFRVDVVADSTRRGTTGLSIGDALRAGYGRGGELFAAASVGQHLLDRPQRLAVTLFNGAAGVGEIAVTAADTRGTDRYATAVTDSLAGRFFSGATLAVLAGRSIGDVAIEARQADDLALDAEARAEDFAARRENFSAVNVDEELAQMITLQNSYAASARVVDTARAMMDDLIRMMG